MFPTTACAMKMSRLLPVVPAMKQNQTTKHKKMVRVYHRLRAPAVSLAGKEDNINIKSKS